MIMLEKVKNQLAMNGFISEFTEFDELKNVFENNAWHHETTFEHTRDVLVEYENFLSDCAALKTVGHCEIAVMLEEKIGSHHKVQLFDLVILFHDLGKAATIVKEGEITKFPKHEEKSFEISQTIIDRFDLSKDEGGYVLSMVKNHGLPHMAFDNPAGVEAGFSEIRRIHPGIYRDLLLLGMLDTCGSKLRINSPAEFAKRMEAYNKALYV